MFCDPQGDVRPQQRLVNELDFVAMKGQIKLYLLFPPLDGLSHSLSVNGGHCSVG